MSQIDNPSPITDDHLAQFASAILSREDDLTEEDARLARDCQILIGDAPGTTENLQIA